MTTVTDAIEAGARALFDEERNESMGGDHWPEFDSDENVGRPIYEEHARASLAAMWPILSAPLRELIADELVTEQTLTRLIGQTDKELGCE